MVKTRIAPSPTGDPHIGTAYTALFNYAFAKKENGQFIIRIEDTDRTRLVPDAEEKILESLDWLGLKPDSEPVRQSDRLNLYQEAALDLIKKEKAYWCNCSPERLDQVRKEQQEKKEVPRYDKKCLNDPPSGGKVGKEGFVVRLKVPESGETVVEDLIRGKIAFQNKDIDDAVLLKSDGWPTYHLAVVVDDHDMEVSHVIRAEEWLSSTPKHILIYAAFGYEPPVFAHLPLLRNPDKSKISKRKNPVSLVWYREQGYLPEALLNYLALMGWSMPDGKEMFSLADFINKFDIKRVDPTGPVFDITKLDWLNGSWIRSLDVKELTERLKEFTKLSSQQIEEILPLVQERMKKLSEFDQLTVYFFAEEVDLDRSLLVQKGKTSEETKSVLEKIKRVLESVVWNKETLETEIKKAQAETGWSNTDLFQTLRVALTGGKTSPPIFDTLEALGKEKSLKRIDKALEVQ